MTPAYKSITREGGRDQWADAIQRAVGAETIDPVQRADLYMCIGMIIAFAFEAGMRAGTDPAYRRELEDACPEEIRRQFGKAPPGVVPLHTYKKKGK